MWSIQQACWNHWLSIARQYYYFHGAFHGKDRMMFGCFSTLILSVISQHGTTLTEYPWKLGLVLTVQPLTHGNHLISHPISHDWKKCLLAVFQYMSSMSTWDMLSIHCLFHELQPTESNTSGRNNASVDASVMAAFVASSSSLSHDIKVEKQSFCANIYVTYYHDNISTAYTL